MRSSRQGTGCENKVDDNESHNDAAHTFVMIDIRSGCDAIHLLTARLNLWLAQPMSGTLRVRAILWLTEQLLPTRHKISAQVLP